MKRPIVTLLGLVGLLFGLVPAVSAQSSTFADPAFQRLWNGTDAAVAGGKGGASWLLGPEPLSVSSREPYAQAPGSTRLVQYFDKARMEINNPNGDRGNLFFVTTGLLPIELMTGRMQVGDATFEQRQPARIPAVGDLDNPFPTYADLAGVYRTQGPGAQVGTAVTVALRPDGSTGAYEEDHSDPLTQVVQVEHGHGIPASFVRHMAERSGTLGSLFVFGYPVSDAYWVKAKVGGVVQPVMVQVFERRVLTYTPKNDLAFQVESGNVGRHYLLWRYPAPTVQVSPVQGPAGTTFTIKIFGLALNEQATVFVTPAFGGVDQLTVIGGNGPVSVDIPTTSQSAHGTWGIGVARTSISLAIVTYDSFIVTTS